MPFRCLWSLFGRQVTIINIRKECVYGINRINTVQDDHLIHNCEKQFFEYEECINDGNEEIPISTNDMNCLKKSTKEKKYKASMLRKETCKEFSENYQTSRKWLKLLQRRLERYELSRMYQKAISTCDTRFRKKNDRRRNTRNIKQNFISAPSSSISRSECRHD